MVLQPLLTRSGDPKYNKWFNLLLHDPEKLTDMLDDWRDLDVSESHPDGLNIEIYLDLSELSSKQTLVLLDDNGKRWDVDNALNPPSSPATNFLKRTQLVVERWRFNVTDESGHLPEQIDNLPIVYKKATVLFRSLYTYAHLLPAYKYWKAVARQTSSSHPTLKPKFRIINSHFKRPGSTDTINVPIVPNERKTVESYKFEPSPSPAGQLCISVEYRNNCEFRVDDAESFLSSQYMGQDEYFKPSLGSRAKEEKLPGSLPTRKRSDDAEKADRSQAYG
ncbi:hypothetical protein LTS18_001421, partial [Coniosporium uncinatum]